MSDTDTKPMDPRVAALVVDLVKASWRESRFLTPDPQRHVNLNASLEAVMKHFNVTPDQVNAALDEADV